MSRRREPSRGITRPKSDVQLARAVRAALGGETIASEGVVWRLDGVLWRRVSDAELHNEIVKLDGLRVEDDIVLTLSEQRIQGLLRLVVDLEREPEFFAAAPSGVAVGDEWISIAADGLRREPLRPEHRARWRIEAEAGALDAEPAQWLALLRDVLSETRGNRIVPRSSADEIVTAIGETIGFSLVGRGATQDARHLLLVGPPNCGKSTILKIVSSLFPPNAQTALRLHDLAARFQSASLSSVRLVVCAELPSRDLCDVESVKAVLTGDPIPVERKYRDPITIRPTAGWIVACNELPAARDASQAIFRRFLVVGLRRAFPISSRDYAAEIIDAERGAIVGWALRCASTALARENRLVPAECQQAAQEWARDSDMVTDWLAERTVPDSDARTSREQAWASYRDYSTARGNKPVSLGTFRRRLSAAGVRGFDGRTGGLPLRLVSTPDPLAWGPTL